MLQNKLSIVVVTYLEKNQKHLDLCLDTIFKQDLPIDYEIILVSSGEYKPTHVISERIKHFHLDERHHYPEGINYGVSKTDPNSKYLLLANDDLLFSKNSIMNMIMTLGDNELILNPMSTCDNFWRYHTHIQYLKYDKPKELNKRFYLYDELEPDFSDIFNNSVQKEFGLLFVPYCCLYGTLMPRKVWDKVGGLDPAFKTGQDDVDFGYRAKMHGIRSAVCMHAFILHFGGRTADFALDDNHRNYNISYFTKKWRGHSEIFSWL